VAAVISVIALIIGHRLGERDGEAATNFGYLITFAAAGALTISALVLVFGFFRGDFSMLYVAENHSTDVSKLAWLYQLSGLWAGREGSLLFWGWLLSLFASWVAYRRMDETDALSNMGRMVTNVILALFGAAMLLTAQPAVQGDTAQLLGPGGELVGEAANS
jgi:cytochrome c-type biogenesis protein CcmF